MAHTMASSRASHRLARKWPSSIELNRVVDGKVEEHWVELDLLGLMQQLGALPEPEQSEEASPT